MSKRIVVPLDKVPGVVWLQVRLWLDSLPTEGPAGENISQMFTWNGGELRVEVGSTVEYIATQEDGKEKLMQSLVRLEAASG